MENLPAIKVWACNSFISAKPLDGQTCKHRDPKILAWKHGIVFSKIKHERVTMVAVVGEAGMEVNEWKKEKERCTQVIPLYLKACSKSDDASAGLDATSLLPPLSFLSFPRPPLLLSQQPPQPPARPI